MNFNIQFIIIFLIILVTGCLKFGEDVETTSPNPNQISRCKSEMYLNPKINILPKGFKLLGSGIDDAIWFKFKTDTQDIKEIFIPAIVNVNEFSYQFTFMNDMEGLKWWDVDGKNLYGDSISLPNARYMRVGIERSEDGCTVYIMWHET